MNARELYGMGPAPANTKADFMTKAAAFMDGLMSGAPAAPAQAATAQAVPAASPSGKTQDEKRGIVNGMLDKLASANADAHKKGLETMSKVLDDIFNK